MVFRLQGRYLDNSTFLIIKRKFVIFISNHFWSCGVLAQYPLFFGFRGSSSRKKKRRQYDPISFSKSKRNKVEDIAVIEDLESLVEGGDSALTEKEAGESNDESNLLKLVDSVDEIKKIGMMWLTSVESDKIENILLSHLIWNNMSIENISILHSESLNEVIKEFSEQSIEGRKIYEKKDLICRIC